MITIGLNLIMKNEEKVLHRLLNTVYKILDWYTVVDTGSSDNSIKIVKDFFDSKGIKGEIYSHDFIDFEDSRNYALEKIKGKCDYAFTIDCDEELILSENFDITKFKEQLSKFDSCISTIIYGDTMYTRRNFFKTSLDFKWIGKVHEYLSCPEYTSVFMAEGIKTLVNSDGASWSNTREKYLKHAEILLKEVNKSNDPRDVFYLAQSYRDAGENEKAIHWYNKRVSMEDGFYEERYASQLNIANIYAKLGHNYQEVIFEWLKCSNLDTLKCDHILNIILELQAQKQWEASYIFSRYALVKFHNKNPYPNRTLFIYHNAYSNFILNSHIENCQKTNRMDELKKLRETMSFDGFLNTIPSAWTGHKDFATWLVNEMKAKTIVDLGVDYGYSTYCLARLNVGKVYGIDLFEGDSQTGFRNNHQYVLDTIDYLKSKHSVNNIQIIKGDFTEVAKTWEKKIDILHIDGYHTYESVKENYETWSKFLNKDGVVLFHDTQSFAGVNKFFYELNLNKLEFMHSSGLGIASNNDKLMLEIKNKYFNT